MPRNSKYSRYSQSALEEALQAVRKGMSVGQAASDWDIPRSTLLGRIKGSQPSTKAHSKQQRLSQQEEFELCSWIRGQHALGSTPTHSQIRDLAVRMLRANHDDMPLGKRWVESFLARNQPIAKKRRSVPLEPARAEGITQKVVNTAMDQSNCHVTDEVGLLERCGPNEPVVGQSKEKRTLQQEDESRAWACILECMYFSQ